MRIIHTPESPFEGVKLPALPGPVFNLAQEGFEPHQYVSAIIQRKLTEDMLALAEVSRAYSDRLTLEQRASSPSAAQQLRELQGSLRRLATLSGEISWGAQIFEQFAQECPLEDFISFPRIQSHLMYKSPTELGRRIDRDWMRNFAPRATGFRNEYSLVAQSPFVALEEYSEIRLRLLQRCAAGRPAEFSINQQEYRSVQLAGVFSDEYASTLKDLMMQHHREPGDPEISRHGVVISRITEDLLNNDVRQNCQMLLCFKNQRVVGVSQFFAPANYPDFAAQLATAFPSSRNAYLLMMLVDPAAQGSVVFPMLMNATLVTLQASGCDRILGEVEHTNLRAMRAYARYRGTIHRELSFPHQAPSGASTQFLGLSIPLS